MSSMPSSPTDSRTRPGVTPVASCSSPESWLWVVLARVDDEAAHVADVGQVAVQLQRVDEPLARLDAALQLERDDRARPAGHVLLLRARATGWTAAPRS